jgi:hypothetical protein
VAVDGEVNVGILCLDDVAESLYEVVNLELGYSIDNITGPMQGGWLGLCGVLKNSVLVRDQ